MLNPRFRKIGVGVGRHTQYLTLVCCTFAGEYVDRENMAEVKFPNGVIEKYSELKDWLDDAVKLTCEIRTEEEAGRIIKKIKKYWEMGDGSTQVSEEVVFDPLNDE